jgi:hypothetical protein
MAAVSGPAHHRLFASVGLLYYGFPHNLSAFPGTQLSFAPAPFYAHLGSKLAPHLLFVTLVSFCKIRKTL